MLQVHRGRGRRRCVKRRGRVRSTKDGLSNMGNKKEMPMVHPGPEGYKRDVSITKARSITVTVSHRDDAL